VPQPVHVIDAVRAGGHPGDQAERLQVRVHPGSRGDPDVLADQRGQAAPFGQRHGRDQAGLRHEIRVVKRRMRPGRAMPQLHLTGVLSIRVAEASVTPIVPAQRAPFVLTRQHGTLFTRWIEAQERSGSGC